MLKKLIVERIIPILTVSGLLYLFVMIVNMVPVNFLSRELISKFRQNGIFLFANDNIYYNLQKFMYATNNVSIYNTENITGKIGEKDSKLDFFINKQAVKLDVKNIKWSSGLNKIDMKDGILQLTDVSSKDLFFFLTSLLKQTKVNGSLKLNLKKIKVVLKTEDGEKLLLEIQNINLEKYLGYVKIEGEIFIDKELFSLECLYEDVISESNYNVQITSPDNSFVMSGSIKNDGSHSGSITGEVSSLSMFNEIFPSSLKNKISFNVFENKTKLRGSYKFIKEKYNLFLNCKQENAEFSFSVNKNKEDVAIVNINFEKGNFNISSKNSDKKLDSAVDIKTLFKIYFSNLGLRMNIFINDATFGNIRINSSKIGVLIDHLKTIKYEDLQLKVGSTNLHLKSEPQQDIDSFNYVFYPVSTEIFVKENLKGVEKIADKLEFGMAYKNELVFFLDVKNQNGQPVIHQSAEVSKDGAIKFANKFSFVELSDNYAFKSLQNIYRSQVLNLVNIKEQSSVHYELLKKELMSFENFVSIQNCTYQDIKVNKLRFNHVTKPSAFSINSFVLNVNDNQEINADFDMFFNSVSVDGVLDLFLKNSDLNILTRLFSVDDVLLFDKEFAIPSMLAFNGNIKIKGENVRLFNLKSSDFYFFGEMKNGILTLNNKSYYNIPKTLTQNISGIVDLRAKPLFDIGLAGLFNGIEWLKDKCKFSSIKQVEFLFLCRLKSEGFSMQKITNDLDAACNLTKGLFILDFDNLYQVAKNLRLGIIEFDPVQILKESRYTDFNLGLASGMLKNGVFTISNMNAGSSLLPFKVNAAYNFYKDKLAIRASSVLFALNYKVPTEFLQIPVFYESDVDLKSCSVIDVFKMDDVNSYIQSAKQYTAEVRK